MTLPVVELSKEDARNEACNYFLKARVMTATGQELLLAAMLQRVYQEGVTAGHDRAAAIVKGARF